MKRQWTGEVGRWSVGLLLTAPVTLPNSRGAEVSGAFATLWFPQTASRIRANLVEDLLFLCHRLPYPPDKGDKIRSYHWLRYLSERYRVHLGTFVDDRRDRVHIDLVTALCADACIRPLGSLRARIRASSGLLGRQPLTVACYRDPVLQRWVRHTLAEGAVRAALVFSSGMATYLQGRKGLYRVMDFVDVDSDKWRQYAASKRGFGRLLYRREAERLAEFECSVAEEFEASILVSEEEAHFFRDRIAAAPGKVHAVPNGVDSRYWDPERDYPNPYPESARSVVFAGAMDYWANAQGACWFAREVWPRVRAACSEARFYVVGARPSRAVRNLAREPSIAVTGRVDDVRPYLAHAHLVAAPLLIARGVQNKVLEALAMGKALVATPQAYAGIERFGALRGCVSGAADEQAREICRWLDQPSPHWFSDVREYVVERYDWKLSLQSLGGLLGAEYSEHVSDHAAVLGAGGVR